MIRFDDRFENKFHFVVLLLLPAIARRRMSRVIQVAWLWNGTKTTQNIYVEFFNKNKEI